jgi:hypothetical protein
MQSSSPHSCYVHCPSHPPQLDDSNYTGQIVQVIQLFIMQFLSSLLHIVCNSLYSLFGILERAIQWNLKNHEASEISNEWCKNWKFHRGQMNNNCYILLMHYCAWELHQPFCIFVILSVENCLISIYYSQSFFFSNRDKQCRKRWVIIFTVYIILSTSYAGLSHVLRKKS